MSVIFSYTDSHSCISLPSLSKIKIIKSSYTCKLVQDKLHYISKTFFLKTDISKRLNIGPEYFLFSGSHGDQSSDGDSRAQRQLRSFGFYHANSDIIR